MTEQVQLALVAGGVTLVGSVLTIVGSVIANRFALRKLEVETTAAKDAAHAALAVGLETKVAVRAVAAQTEIVHHALAGLDEFRRETAAAALQAAALFESQKASRFSDP